MEWLLFLLVPCVCLVTLVNWLLRPRNLLLAMKVMKWRWCVVTTKGMNDGLELQIQERMCEDECTSNKDDWQSCSNWQTRELDRHSNLCRSCVCRGAEKQGVRPKYRIPDKQEKTNVANTKTKPRTNHSSMRKSGKNTGKQQKQMSWQVQRVRTWTKYTRG